MAKTGQALRRSYLYCADGMLGALLLFAGKNCVHFMLGRRLRAYCGTYCGDTSVVQTPSRLELLYIRSQITIVAKAFGLDAIDMVCVNYKDLDYLKDECEDEKRLGFNGKQTIHPAQVDIIHSTYVPTEKEILRAAKILHQMKVAHSSQKGAFSLEIEWGALANTFSHMSHVTPDPLDDSIPVLDQESSHLPEHPQKAEEIHLIDDRQIVITTIRATDLTLGLQRIPVGFYVTVQIDSAQWQTANKSVHVDLDVVEWNEQIVLPHEPSCKMTLKVYASFELGSMLGHGDILRKFEICVAELLDRSENSRLIVFQPKEGVVVSPCTSLFIKVERQLSCEPDIGVLCPITVSIPHNSPEVVLRTDAGHCTLGRYYRTQNCRDLDQSIKHFECARDFCPNDHPCWSAALFNLATATFISCQVNGKYFNLDIPISLFQDALDLRPIGHPDRPATQLHLAVAFLSRFVKHGFETDADIAEELLNEVLDVCHTKSYIYRSALLAINSYVLQTARSADANDLRVEGPMSQMLPWSPNELARRVRLCMHSNDPQALDEVISLHYEALKYCSAVHAQYGQLLCNLGSALYTRSERQGIPHDLDKAIEFHRQALDLRPVGHPDRCSSLNNLAAALHTTFKHRGNDEDLDEAIIFHRQTLVLQPHRGNYEDLNEAITFLRQTLVLQPVGHPDRSSSLNNLASALRTSFEHRGNEDHLDEVIAFHREALNLRPVGHPNRCSSFNNLAAALCTSFEHRGNDEDLDEAITFHREALDLRPVGHPNRCSALNNLSNTLHTSFVHRGDYGDLDEAIAFHRQALDLRPVGHPDRWSSLNNLANTLRTSFKHRGNDEDLDEAITLNRQALDLRPCLPFNNLAVTLITSFKHRGNDEDLDEAITFHRQALDLRPVGHPDRSSSLNNLASALNASFTHQGNEDHLDEAITLDRQVLDLRPVGHPNRWSSLNNLANTLLTSFMHRGNGEDLDEAITFHREALDLRPVGHPDWCSLLHNLANTLRTNFEHRGNYGDLDEAIAFHRQALGLRPVGHPHRCSSLHNLSNTLSARFKHRGNYEDLNEALLNARSALSLIGTHDPVQSAVHGNISDIYVLYHKSEIHSTGKDANNLNAAMAHLKAASQSHPSGLLSRLRMSLHWASIAEGYTHSTLLEAYATSMQLLDSYVSTTASVSSRHHTMKDFPRTLAVDAASCALQVDDECCAVELLEQGRTTIWTQMARFRMPLDNLRDRGDHAEALVTKFRELSYLLDKPPAERPQGAPRVKVEAEATRYTHLVKEWSKAVEEIRKLEGFSRFLLSPLFSDLRDAARDGPVIILVASRSSCNAIIVPHQQSPVRIQLATDLAKLGQQVVRLRQTVRGASETRGRLVEVLRELWDDIVCPVVEHLRTLGFTRQYSRIWWCPTLFFNFLPLHAAGEYRPNGKNLSNLYISSYTPSLTALIRARRSHDRSQTVSFAAIGQNRPAGATYALQSVESELDLVRSLVPAVSTVSFTKVTSAESTKAVALRTLQANHWLHFACHGTQNFMEPFNSAFLMRDKPLTLLDISQTDLSRHEFAFLSACETAVGDKRTPDEMIHLAAGLQFAGVKSVIGTFWAVEDATVRHLVEAFYKNFCGDGKMNSKRAARALHKAVQSLATNKDIPLDQRIVFMHIGL
ncbi:hypothetical protein K503DRAFT_866605 [Rhizopogon vinicolor AM-OR11-026]|uniref:Uncharacterized protein n=1 Tax=Rhizopogon vinicolor AM-OR11-026 TaxID=1314800 RepID=A0A1B7MYX3_9AGAM|nr:hypothetical protein K503DRAFT_866605 [Rhizopogon vinicolor AM-OR11-026]